jgi:predicted dehydrogenase
MLGYKFMGRAHSNAYNKLGMFFDAGAEVRRKAICGRDRAAVTAAAERLGWESAESDWDAFVTRDDLDVIDITAPSGFHKEAAIAAAQNGKHVFCEKPLALNADDAREILAAVQKHNVKHQVGFNYRFSPAARLAKKLIADGRLGTIYHFRGKYLQDFIMDPQVPLVWRLDKDVAGSGALGDIGAHIIDLARYLVGDFVSVMGIQKTFVTKRPKSAHRAGLSALAADGDYGDVTVDDATLFLAAFENGALGSFEATRFANGHKNDMSFEVNGSKGSLRFDLLRMNELEFFSSEDAEGLQGFRNIQATEDVHPYADKWWPAGHVIGYEHTFVHELYEFVSAIVNDTETAPDFSDGLECCRVLDAVELSASRGRVVEIKEI